MSYVCLVDKSHFATSIANTQKSQLRHVKIVRIVYANSEGSGESQFSGVQEVGDLTPLDN